MTRNNWMSLTSTRMESADYKNSSNSTMGFPRRWSSSHYNCPITYLTESFVRKWREGMFDEAKLMMYSFRQSWNLRRSGERAKLTYST